MVKQRRVHGREVRDRLSAHTTVDVEINSSLFGALVGFTLMFPSTADFSSSNSPSSFNVPRKFGMNGRKASKSEFCCSV